MMGRKKDRNVAMMVRVEELMHSPSRIHFQLTLDSARLVMDRTSSLAGLPLIQCPRFHVECAEFVDSARNQQASLRTPDFKQDNMKG